MKYYLDTEFNDFGGKLLSMGLIREDGKCYYAYQGVINASELTPFVKRYVYPYIHHTPTISFNQVVTNNNFTPFLANVFRNEQDTNNITIVSDWPDDIKYFCEALITTPGNMLGVPNLKFELTRVDSYPNPIERCVRHNSMWDAIALRYTCTGQSNYH